MVERIAGERVDAWNIHLAAQRAAARGEDVIILSVGDPEFATPAPSLNARWPLRDGDTHYSPVDGRADLRAAIARRHAAATGLDMDADNVIVVAGAQNGLFSAALCLCQAGDEVLVPEPMYLTYEASIRASGAELVPVPVKPADGFHLDLAALEAAVTRAAARSSSPHLATPPARRCARTN